MQNIKHKLKYEYSDCSVIVTLIKCNNFNKNHSNCSSYIMNKFKLHQFGRPKTVQDQRHRYQ